jgi:hypothetical protein
VRFGGHATSEHMSIDRGKRRVASIPIRGFVESSLSRFSRRTGNPSFIPSHEKLPHVARKLTKAQQIARERLRGLTNEALSQRKPDGSIPSAV